MKSKRIVLIAFLSLFLGMCFFNPSTLSGKSKTSKLPPKYKKWLKEEVVYIITPMEKKVFLQLNSNKERDMFIEAFWKQRDPNPNTEENEFRIEHYRRFKYANETLGRGTPTKGWRTEMGRIYIILGEPKYTEYHENISGVYPVIIWFYQGMAPYGLPDAFSVVFFKKDGSGDYLLYSPIQHGPQSLLIHYNGDVNDYITAYNELMQINNSIAKVSVSLVEGESTTGTRPTMASDILVQKKIPSVPAKKVNDAYAAKLLKYKEYIDVDYSVNYINNSAMVRVIQDNAGIFFVHYLIEPQKMSLEQFEESFYANLEINGSVTDQKDKTIYQFRKKAPIKLERFQLEKIKNSLFSFQDIFPLIEGKYKISILIRNVVSKEFTSIEREITIPKIEKPAISSLVLANKARKMMKYRGSTKAFLVNDTQLLPSPRNDFVKNDDLFVYFQLYGLTPEQLKTGHIKFTIYKDTEPIHTEKKSLSEYPNPKEILQHFSLKGYRAAYYSVRASIYENENRFLVLGEEDFYISPMSTLPRPWVVSLSSPADNPDTLNKLGIQYSNNEQFEKAAEFLAKAYYQKPHDARLAVDYCRILNKLKRFDKVIAVGEAFINTKDKNQFIALMGIASEAVGKYADAIKYYKEYLEYYGTNLKILNSIGVCYYKQGEIEEALVAWERSLELFPKQNKLREHIKKIRDQLKLKEKGQNKEKTAEKEKKTDTKKTNQ